LALDGVYENKDETFQFHPIQPPTDEDIANIVKKIATRTLKYLTKKGYFCQEEELYNWEHDLFKEDEPMLAEFLAASIRYRIAFGQRAGKEVRRIGSMARSFYQEPEIKGDRCASIGGFSLHANVSCETNQRKKLEQICNYVARPPIAQDRLIQRADGNLLYKLKRPYDDGTEYLLFSPLELLEKLASLIPRPRINTIRYHGILAPHARLRAKIVPTPEKNDEPEKNIESQNSDEKDRKTDKRLSWCKLLARVFNIDISTCPICGQKLKVIAAINDSNTIEKILSHLDLPTTPPTIAPARAPPQADFDWT